MNKDPKDTQAVPAQPQTNIVDAWQIHHDSMGGGTDMPVAYVNKRTAELECEAKQGRADRCCEGYAVKAVKVRLISPDEGAVGRNLVAINRADPKEVLKTRALAKLTREEREALNL